MKAFISRVARPVALVLVCVFAVACGSPAKSPPSGAGQGTVGQGTDAQGAAPSAVDGSTAAVGEVPDGYRIAQGDRIAIQVFDEPDLTLESAIGASGIINYSYLGDLQVTGKTPQQLERLIAQKLEDGYLVNPSVNVTVLEYRPFYINGEVRTPGSYPYQPGLTLSKAIALAGGLTERASRRKMFILKASNEQKQARASMSTPVSPGDIITIQEGFF